MLSGLYREMLTNTGKSAENKGFSFIEAGDALCRPGCKKSTVCYHFVIINTRYLQARSHPLKHDPRGKTVFSIIIRYYSPRVRYYFGDPA